MIASREREPGADACHGIGAEYLESVQEWPPAAKLTPDNPRP